MTLPYLDPKDIAAMSETKFTPGPWRSNGSDIFVEGDDGDDRIIAGIGKSGGFRSSVYSPIVAHKPEGRANAHLIAAAPELYEVLEKMLERDRSRYESTPEAQRYFRENNAQELAVLAKARGEAA